MNDNRDYGDTFGTPDLRREEANCRRQVEAEAQWEATTKEALSQQLRV